MRVSAERYPQRYPLFLRMSANGGELVRKGAPRMTGLGGEPEEDRELPRTPIILIDHQQHFKANPLILLRYLETPLF